MERRQEDDDQDDREDDDDDDSDDVDREDGVEESGSRSNSVGISSDISKSKSVTLLAKLKAVEIEIVDVGKCLPFYKRVVKATEMEMIEVGKCLPFFSRVHLDSQVYSIFGNDNGSAETLNETNEFG